MFTYKGFCKNVLYGSLDREYVKNGFDLLETLYKQQKVEIWLVQFRENRYLLRKGRVQTVTDIIIQHTILFEVAQIVEVF